MEAEPVLDGIEFEKLGFKLKLNVPKNIILTMEKNPEDRTEADLVSIGRMMKNLPSFRKYTSNMQRLFCKIVRYTKCGKRRIVLRKGHLGYNLYFIYSGAVSVVLDKDEGNVFVKPEVVVLRKGACFGEIALLQHTRRNATVVCTEESELLFVEKEDFLENGLHIAMEDEFKQRYNFFRNWKALESWSDQQVKDLSYVSRMEEFSHNKVIVKDSKKNEWLWFIIRGSCDVLRLVDLEKCSEYRKIVLHGHNIEEYLMDNTRKKQKRNRPNTASSKSLSSGKSQPLAASTPDIKIYEPSENSVTSSGRRKGSVSFSSEVSNSKTSIDTTSPSMYSQQPISDELDHSLLESESDEEDDDDIIPKNANVKEINPMAEDKSLAKALDIGQGIFVKVDELRDGRCFGIEYLFEDLEKPVTLSLVSRGCEIIHVPRSRFYEMCSQQSLMYIMLNCIKTYPDDNKLCERFLEINQWDSYKCEVLEGALATTYTVEKYQNSLRNSAKRREFYKMCDNLKDPASKATRSAVALFDANQNSSVDRSLGFGSPRSMTTTGMRQNAPDFRARSAPGSAKGHRRQQRPRTCPAGLARNNRLTNRAQTAHRIQNVHRNGYSSGDGYHNNTTRTTTEARRERLMSLTLKSRSRSRRRSNEGYENNPEGVLITKSGYRVTTTPVLASGSQRTIQLVKSVRSPEHERKMRMVQQY